MAGNKRTWMYLQRPFENEDVKPDKARRSKGPLYRLIG